MSVRTIYQLPTDNIAGNAVITSSAEDPSYPSSYLYDRRITRAAKLTAVSGWWKFAFPNSQVIKLVALGPNNFDQGLSVVLEGNSIDDFTSPAISVPITIPPRWESGRGYHPWADVEQAEGYSDSGYPFWRLNIGANSKNIELGQIWLSPIKRMFESDWLMEGSEDEEDQDAILIETEFGQTTAYNKYIRRRTFFTPFNASARHMDELRAWHRSCGGAAVPTLMIPRSDKNDAVWCRHSRSYRRRMSDGRSYVTFELKEESHGLIGITF